MELPEHLHTRANELLTMEQDGADRRRYWVVVLGLKPMLDGNMWCFLWGDDLQSGVAGFGDTVYAAMMDFDRAMDQKENANGDLSAASTDNVRRDVGLASEFIKGVEFALSLVRDSDTCGVRESLANCPETYRQARREAVQAIERWLKLNNSGHLRTTAGRT